MPRDRKPKKPSLFRARTSNRVRGFFAFTESFPYEPRGTLVGQLTAESCVPACCRMLLLDHFPSFQANYRFSESFLRAALETDAQGTYVSRIPALFQQFGVATSYVYSAEVTADQLRTAIDQAPIIVRLTSNDQEGHVVIVEAIEEEFVALRDPLPEGKGSAYRVAWQTFLAAWQSRTTGFGQAVLVR